MIQLLRNYLQLQINEIKRDNVLSRFTFALILVHLFTALFWFYQGFVDILQEPIQSYCWPYLPGCDVVKDFLAPAGQGLFIIYVLLSFLGLFIYFKSKAAAYSVLLILEILKLLYGSLDYRFMGNYHFMPHIVTLLFLFVPQKIFWIRIWIVTFYFAAATLKFNLEWLSGGSMSWKVPFGKSSLLQILAVAALLVEVCAPQLLLFKQKPPRWLGLFLLALFHLASYYWVGFFYPAVMCCLLSIYVLELMLDEPLPKADLKKISFVFVFLLWVSFIITQLFALNNAREFALMGEKRLFTLNMFDARSSCRGFFVIYKKNEIVEVDFKNEDLAVRVQCDDILFVEQARHLCENKSADTLRIEAYLSSRLFSDAAMTPIIREQNICTRW